MKLVLKNISHFDFFEQLEVHSREIFKFLESKNYEKNETQDFTDRHYNEVKAFILKSIDSYSEKITNLLTDKYVDIFDNFYSFYAYNLPKEIEKEVVRLDSFYQSLTKTISYLSIVESLYDPEIKIKISDINEKTDFVLDKLNALFGDKFYSIETILNLNDLYNRSGETREIGEELKRKGYLILADNYGNSDLSKISVKGASYITRKNKQNTKQNRKTQLDIKIENISEHLEKLGLGQEVIFDEINELKELQHKLSKKSWSQLLKGKLIDLALNKLINMETASSIFEYLTNDNFKILK